MELTVIMKITIFDSKITKMLASFFLAVALVSGVSVVNKANIVEAHTISPQKERKFAAEQLAQDQKKYTMYQVSEGSEIRNIQDKLIAYNSDRLNYNDGKHDRWLDPVWIVENGTVDGASAAGMALSGYIKIHAKANEYVQGIDERNYIAYSYSSALLAHEFGHFANQDTLSWKDGEKYRWQDEHEADKTAIEFLDKVPDYSISSMLLIGSGEDGIHSSPEEVTKYIEDWSYGRVKFIQYDWWNCIFTVDGKLFNPPNGNKGLRDTVDTKGMPRTLYLAGQIASCIHQGIWKKENIAYAKESYFFKNGRDNKTTLAVWSDSSCNGRPAKILATFDFDFSKNGQYSQEEKWQIENFNYTKNFPVE